MKLKIGIVALAAAAISATAFADIMAIGDPFEGDSWGQRFITDPGHYGIDMLAVKMQSSGDAFDSTAGPALTNFSRPGWEVVYQDDRDYPTVIIATGPATPDGHQLQFDVIFEGDSGNSFTFSAVAFAGENRIEGNDLKWGPGWSYPTLSWDVDYEDLELLLIPLPPPVWLAAAGLAGVVVLRRRKAA